MVKAKEIALLSFFLIIFVFGVFVIVGRQGKTDFVIAKSEFLPHLDEPTFICPIHDEVEPLFYIYNSQTRYYCKVCYGEYLDKNITQVKPKDPK